MASNNPYNVELWGFCFFIFLLSFTIHLNFYRLMPSICSK
ncbi:hypothetical protein PROVRETT_06553 [Providencia rettgeri DSM 1131]|nr:hypothetical protein PROVRETT_06553 [Providencia rettgeri DSM 1131]